MSLLLLSLLSPTRLTKVWQSEHDDNGNESTVSNDESICPNRTEGMVVDKDSNSDGNDDLTEDKRAKKSALALNFLGNISRKTLDSISIIALVVVGKLLLQVTSKSFA
jgi:hypothetical protein